MTYGLYMISLLIGVLKSMLNTTNSLGLNEAFGNEVSPMPLFETWFAEAKETEINDPNAFALATVDVSGQPSVRMLLLKGIKEKGFIFYTNMNSRKANDLQSNQKASICFHWKSLQRQIRIYGSVAQISEVEADAYFETRDYDSQIGAWASLQSSHMKQRSNFDERILSFKAKYPEGSTVPRPPHWSGWVLLPNELEFWLSAPARLHERLIYKFGDNGNWVKSLLYP